MKHYTFSNKIKILRLDKRGNNRRTPKNTVGEVNLNDLKFHWFIETMTSFIPHIFRSKQPQ